MRARVPAHLKRLASVALAVVVIQVALGGWVTSNYAALACPDFPTCHGEWIPEMDFAKGFDVTQTIGPNYLGGLLSADARVAIHFSHRVGAIAVLLVVGLLAWRLGNRPIAWMLACVLAAQLGLGVANVVFAPAAGRGGLAQRRRGGPDARCAGGTARRGGAAGRGGTRLKRYSRSMKWAIVALLGAGLVGAGVAFSVLAPEPALTDEELGAFGFMAFPAPRPLGEFELADAAGGRFDEGRLRAQWSFVFFGYANCPDICPTTMAVMGAAEERLLAAGDEAFQGILVSVDPERDTPTNLKAYVGSFSARFVGVTGAVAEVTAFAKDLHVGFARATVADSALGYLVDHSGHIAVIDPLGRHYGFIRPPHDAQQLATLTRALTRRHQNERPS